MLRVDSKNVNYSAACLVNDTQIAYLSANRLTNDGTNYRCDMNITIDNLAMYLENISTFENDFADFMADIGSIDD